MAKTAIAINVWHGYCGVELTIVRKKSHAVKNYS